MVIMFTLHLTTFWFLYINIWHSNEQIEQNSKILFIFVFLFLRVIIRKYIFCNLM